jgi:hypothetical protein
MDFSKGCKNILNIRPGPHFIFRLFKVDDDVLTLAGTSGDGSWGGGRAFCGIKLGAVISILDQVVFTISNVSTATGMLHHKISIVPTGTLHHKTSALVALKNGFVLKNDHCPCLLS